MEIKELLADIIETVKNSYGNEFLEILTKKLNQILDADYTFIAMFDVDKYESQAISLVAKGEMAPNITYSLAHTPCANVFDDTVCIYPTNVCEKFPLDQLLVDMKIDGYIGTPLHDSKGKVMGLIVGLYEKEIKNIENILTLFRIFSGRIAAELERSAYEKKLETYNQELSVLVKERTIALDRVNEELLIRNQVLQEKTEELTETLVDLRTSQKRLIESEKMASIGILSAGIAHEINNPLNFIQGGVSALTNFLADKFPEESLNLSPYFQAILEGVNRSTAIVKGLNHFSRTVDKNDEMCDVREVLDNCLAMIVSETRNRIIIEKHYLENPVVCIGNVGKLHQAFLNLFTNAVQAIAEKGNIQISIRKLGANYSIKIKDSGEGISPENLSKINMPFFTTKEPGKGTGLGLSIAYKIIDEHKGNIQVHSIINEGTEFEILLPGIH